MGRNANSRREKRREIGVTLERHSITRARVPSATFTESSSRFLSREREREGSEAILSIDIDETTYLKYTVRPTVKQDSSFD